MRPLREDGFSLLEILVAIAIFGILFGGLVAMMKQENRIIRDSIEVLSARLKANDVMETLKTRPFERLKSFSSLVISELKQMTIHVVVSDFKHTTDLKKIVVTVKWFNLKGREKQVILTTLRSKHSLTRVTGVSRHNVSRIAHKGPY